uniref:Outer membrane efflux protein n=1 Tax=uncultured bacterium BLR2 TaxID=506520 RepID=C0IN57_9BACT|nr:outer membrane efflux protein [uncultured bacterium BLR2]
MLRLDRLVASVACTALCACAALHPPAPVQLKLRDSAPITAAVGAGDAQWPGTQWWRDYNDPTLDALIAKAIGQAPGISIADARIRAAQQEVRLAGASRGLRVDANAQFVRQRLSDNGLLPAEFLGFNWYDQSDVGVSVRYQFDWWGKQRAALEAALDRSRASAAERRSAELGLAAAVSSAYFEWQACAARSTLLEESITLLERQLQLTQRRAAAQLDTVDSALSLQQSLAVHREELAILAGQQQLQVIALAALLGTDTQSLPALGVRELPRPASALPDNVGANLLARRPDIAASRWRVEAALRDTDVARASFYPDISLRALAGLSSIELGRLLRSDSGVPAFGFAVDLPLFDAGLRQARHGAARASLDVAIAAYDDTVVNAAREASAAAATILQAAAQRAQREQQLGNATALLRVAQARLDRQVTHIGPILSARLQEINARDALISVDLAAVLADIQLRQALGGGPASMENSP